jgi:predicted ribosome quality control (RQC) complex YloA/Tae2 family protein
MSYDGLTLHHIIKELKQKLRSGRITKIYQLNAYDLLFFIYANNEKHQVFFSTSPNYARMHLTTMPQERPQNPPNFCMFLRKHLEGGILEDITQKENDRVAIFYVKKRDELGDIVTKKIIYEATGRHSNFIITDQNNKVLEAIKHVMPFEDAARTVYPSSMYQFPETNQLNPFTLDYQEAFFFDPSNFTDKNIRQTFMGFSPLLAKEVMHLFEVEKVSMKDAIKAVTSSKDPVIIKGKKDAFYAFDLLHKEGIREHFETMNECVDRFYYKRDQINQLKQQSKDVIKFIDHKIDKLSDKIDKLSTDLSKTRDLEGIRKKGELIIANLHQMKKGDKSLTCHDYYEDKEITIPLDETKTPVQNSEKYFKQYKKRKASIPHLEKQIKLAKKERSYFENLQHQIKHATTKDVDEIKEELIHYKYMKSSKQKKKMKSKPNFEKFIDDDGVEILVGKNNLQNDYITNKLAKYNEVWFHVKDAPGSHVLVRKAFPLSETTIRTAAMLASYFSSLRDSSSVPVDYCEARYLKKIKGKMNSNVIYSNQKTIYIDPEESFVIQLRENK